MRGSLEFIYKKNTVEHNIIIILLYYIIGLIRCGSTQLTVFNVDTGVSNGNDFVQTKMYYKRAPSASEFRYYYYNKMKCVEKRKIIINIMTTFNYFLSDRGRDHA